MSTTATPEAPVKTPEVRDPEVPKRKVRQRNGHGTHEDCVDCTMCEVQREGGTHEACAKGEVCGLCDHHVFHHKDQRK